MAKSITELITGKLDNIINESVLKEIDIYFGAGRYDRIMDLVGKITNPSFHPN